MRVISGIVPVVSGAMTFDGRSINGLSAHRIVERGDSHTGRFLRAYLAKHAGNLPAHTGDTAAVTDSPPQL